MSYNASSLNAKLSKHASFFGIRLWVLLVVLLLLFTFLITTIMFICIIYICRPRKSKPFKPHFLLSNPISCKKFHGTSSMDRRLLSSRISEIDGSMNMAKPDRHQHQVVSLSSPDDQASGATTDQVISDINGADDLEAVARCSADEWGGIRVSLREIEVATNAFADENVIGNGDHGLVYRGILLNTTRVAVKRLSSKSQAEDFKAEMDVIGHARHKNLVKLLGYCMEGGYRILVNEYVDNGNLHQWLHECPEQVSPLGWGTRMNIIQGIAKGMAYLHEDVGPKIIHRDLKSSNILLDHQWNPKISNFGIANLFGLESNNVMLSTESSGNFGGALDERIDVYRFGILVMEIVCGRTPVDPNQPQVYLIDWLKSVVANQKIKYVVDPKLPQMPSPKELKRIILLALRCVDGDTKNMPKMGDVIHMLEPRDLLLHDAALGEVHLLVVETVEKRISRLVRTFLTPMNGEALTVISTANYIDAKVKNVHNGSSK